jgi:hypothetical protein
MLIQIMIRLIKEQKKSFKILSNIETFKQSFRFKSEHSKY